MALTVLPGRCSGHIDCAPKPPSTICAYRRVPATDYRPPITEYRLTALPLTENHRWEIRVCTELGRIDHANEICTPRCVWNGSP